MGQIYTQDSVLYINNGIGTLIGVSHDPDVYPAYGMQVVVGQLKLGYANGMYYTKVRNRKFAFQSQIKLHFDTINGNWGAHILGGKVAKIINEGLYQQ